MLKAKLNFTSLCLIVLWAFWSPISFGQNSDVIISANAASPEKLYTLEECYQLALLYSQQIAIGEEAIEETKATFFKAASEALGNVDFVITQTLQDPTQSSGGSSVGSTLTASSRRERRFEFDQPIFQGFKSLGALRGAGSLSRQRQAEKLRLEHLLYLEVANAFYSVLESEKNLEIISDIRNLLEDRVLELKDREKIGRSRASEVVTANSNLKLIEAEAAAARGELLTSQYELQFLTGAQLSAKNLKEEEVRTPDSQLESYLLLADKRPDVEASRQAVKTLWQQIVIAQSGLWPQVILEGNAYNKREGFQSGVDWDLLFKITVPIFHGGENAGNIKEAWSLWKQGKYSFEHTRRTARLEIEQAFQNWLSAKEQSAALEEAVKASEENFNIQKEEYTRNLVNNLEVLEALQTYYQARQQALSVWYDSKIRQHELRVATGLVQ